MYELFLHRIVEDVNILKILFSNEATFLISGTVNRHNRIIWGIEHPHEYI